MRPDLPSLGVVLKVVFLPCEMVHGVLLPKSLRADDYIRRKDGSKILPFFYLGKKGEVTYTRFLDLLRPEVVFATGIS